MNPRSQSLRAEFDVLHEASLVDRPADLHAAMKLADALIVRNRTQVDAALIASAPRLKVVGGSVSDSTTSTPPHVQHVASR